MKFILKTNIEDMIAGDIKLGFVMSKGQLEIAVFEAKNINKLDGLYKGELN